MQTNLTEGPRDPNIFKAIFTAGIPGSGKTTVGKTLTDGTGMKTVNFDDVYIFLKRKGSDHSTSLKKADSLTGKMLDSYVRGRLGLIIDKTAWDYSKVSELKSNLESLGYSTFMVYVNTDIEVAKSRVKSRFATTGRNVDEDYIEKVFTKLSTNIGKYQSDFGDKFVIVDNSQSSNLASGVKYAEQKVRKFLNEPLGKTARDWMSKTP